VRGQAPEPSLVCQQYEYADTAAPVNGSLQRADIIICAIALLPLAGVQALEVQQRGQGLGLVVKS
jgi:hypothetical protein